MQKDGETMDNYKSSEPVQEHILVCLSASPSNSKIIKTAAKMVGAFGGNFTALYVQTADSEKMSEEDKNRLQSNMQLAIRLGADITTIYANDISYQIADFARVSGVTKIVIGRSNIKRRHFFSKATLTEKLIEIAPNLDIHIIPDNNTETSYNFKNKDFKKYLLPSIKDLIITAFILIASTGIGNLFYVLGFTEANIIAIYLLGALLTPLLVKSYICSAFFSFASVLLFNFLFTEPRLTLHAYKPGYPVTFAILLVASLITGILANRLKEHAKQSSMAAFRMKMLFDTNQLLQKVQDDKDIISITASQLMKLLKRSVVIYPEENGKLSKGYLFAFSKESNEDYFFNPSEKQVAQWVYDNKHRAGATTKIYSKAKCLYFAIRLNNKVYGVIGIHIGEKNLDSFENSVLLSVLGECALAIENIRNAKEKERTAVLAKNEQLRATLLRAISHDLRTPLTSISGNADYLLNNYDMLDEETRNRAFLDIYSESQWLISLVENLLSITRLEDNRMNFNISVQLMDEVIDEALKHIKSDSSNHIISVEYSDELLLAKMDARLIIQVIINLVDNAIKYTPADTEIKISAENSGKFVKVSVSDTGNGIEDNEKQKVFEMFYTGDSKIADSRRSLGLGLHLCRSIINAHGGEIKLKDNIPHGCVFEFTIPSGEVKINEQAQNIGC